jgi:hypothetical protein
LKFDGLELVGWRNLDPWDNLVQQACMPVSIPVTIREAAILMVCQGIAWKARFKVLKQVCVFWLGGFQTMDKSVVNRSIAGGEAPSRPT